MALGHCQDRFPRRSRHGGDRAEPRLLADWPGAAGPAAHSATALAPALLAGVSDPGAGTILRSLSAGAVLVLHRLLCRSHSRGRCSLAGGAARRRLWL